MYVTWYILLVIIVDVNIYCLFPDFDFKLSREIGNGRRYVFRYREMQVNSLSKACRYIVGHPQYKRAWNR